MKLSITATRTIRPAEYESKTMSVTMDDVEVPEGADLDAVQRDLFAQAQATVLSQLGIEFVIDPDGIVREEDPVQTLTTQLGGQVQQPFVPPAPVPYPPAPAPAPVGGMPGPCPKCGHAEWWDNRADNNRKRASGYQLGAEFKCKNCKNAIWPDDFNSYKHLPREPRS